MASWRDEKMQVKAIKRIFFPIFSLYMHELKIETQNLAQKLFAFTHEFNLKIEFTTTLEALAQNC